MSSHTTVFLATSKGTSPKEAEYLANQIKDNFPTDIKVYQAQKEFEAHFPSCQGWDGWSDFVATSTDFVTRTARYDEVICTMQKVGRSTADIVKKSLSHGKPVKLWKMQRLHRVIGVQNDDPENWQSGWSLITS